MTKLEKLMRMNGIDATSMTRKSQEERIKELERKVEELTSYIDSMGKTVLDGDGSAEKPYMWAAGIELIPNAYYEYGGVRYVWMGAKGTATKDDPPEDVGGSWVQF